MTIDAPAPAADTALSASDAVSGVEPDVPASQSARDARKLGALRMIWRAAAAYPGRVSMALFALVTSSAATLGVPMMFRLIIDRAFAPGKQPEDIAIWFEGLMGVVLVLALATALRFYNVSWLAERVVADIRIAVQRNLLRLPPSFFEENSPREISSRLTSDTTLIEQAVGSTASMALRNLITGTGGILFLFLLAPRLTLWLVLGIVCVVAPITLFGRRLRGASRSSQDRVAEIGGLVSEVLGATRIVQAFNQEKLESDRFSATVERTFETAKRRIAIRATMTSVVIFLVMGALNLLMWRGAVGVARHEITGGTIAAFVLTGGVVAGAFGALSEVYGDLVRAAGAASRLSELLQEKPAIAAPARPIVLPEPARGAISFEGVTFRYPTRPEYTALNDFTLKVEPGETVAIVGPSGAGKSTIFQLAERFYDPATGAIKLDGVPLTAPTLPTSAAASLWCLRRAHSSPPARVTICAMAIGTPAMPRSGMPPPPPMPRASCAICPKASTPSWARAARACRAASASASPSPAPCCARRRSCCSTRPPARWMPRASGWCRMRSIG